MRWDDTYEGAHKQYTWHDLLDDDEKLLGYVRENLVDRTFIAQINSRVSSSKKFDNLEDAKNFIIAHYVVEKLEGA